MLGNFLYNLINIFLYLFPFGVFDNIGAFFPQIYTSGILMVVIFIVSVIMGYVFVVFFASILLVPIDNDNKATYTDANNQDRKEQVAYKRTFLGVTIRFILGSKNILTYGGSVTKFFATMGLKLLPLVFIIAFLYFPIMPNSKGFHTVGQFMSENGTVIKTTLVEMATGNFSGEGSKSELEAKYGTTPMTADNLRNPDYRKSRTISSYQNDAAVKAEAYKELQKYSHITDIKEYDDAINGYINAKMSLLMQNSAGNKTIEQEKQVVYSVLDSMDKQLHNYKERAKGRQSVQLFGGKVIYTGLNVEQFGFVFTVLNAILAFTFFVFLLLLSGWKNIILIYLAIMEGLAKRFERLSESESFKRIQSMNIRIKSMGTDIQEWDYIVENSGNRNLYLILIGEVLIRMTFVYYIFFF